VHALPARARAAAATAAAAHRTEPGPQQWAWRAPFPRLFLCLPATTAGPVALAGSGVVVQPPEGEALGNGQGLGDCMAVQGRSGIASANALGASAVGKHLARSCVVEQAPTERMLAEDGLLTCIRGSTQAWRPRSTRISASQPMTS
jgi:hypothetical protein